MLGRLNKVCLKTLKYSDFIKSKNLLVYHNGFTAAVKMMPVDTCEGVRFLVDGEIVATLSGVRNKIYSLSKKNLNK